VSKHVTTCTNARVTLHLRYSYVDQAGFIVDLPVDLCLARLTSFVLIIHATRRLRNIATGIDVLRTVEHFDLTRLLRGKRIDLPVTSSFIFVIVLCLSCD